MQILEFGPQSQGDFKFQADFERLNREWLEKYFSVEAIDIEYFQDPQKKILDAGGMIFFAECEGKIVGTCALLKEDDGFELAKMAVTPAAQGRGIGEALARAAIQAAKLQGAKAVKLFTHSSLAPAIRIYAKLGFQETFRGPHPRYQRADVGMVLPL